MNERRSAALNEAELRFAGEQGFFDKSATVRFLLGLALVLSLILFLHIREVPVDMLEPNSIATQYVVSQVDFEFLDRDATRMAQQEAVRHIGKIHRLSDPQISLRKGDFENIFLRDDEARQQLGDPTFDEVSAVTDALQRVLIQVKFTDPRTLRKLYEAGIPSTQYVVYTPLNISQEQKLPRKIWEVIGAQILKEGRYSPVLIGAALKYFEEKTWRLEEDIPAQQEIRSTIENRVPDKITKVQAGSRIIDKGKRVETRDISMMQAMKKAISEKRNLWHPLTLLGSTIMALVITALSSAFIKYSYPALYRSNKKLSLLVTVVVLTLLFAKVTEYILVNSTSSLSDTIRYPLFVPFAAIMTCNLMSASLAVFVSGLLTVVISMSLVFDQTGFMMLNLTAALIVILSTPRLYRRKEIFLVCAKAWVGCVFVLLAIHLYDNTAFQASMVYDMIGTAFFMGVTAMLVLGILPLLESSFDVMSDVSLMEYMDPNHELLKRLSFEAAGTYQHTLMVCNIAEAAAVAIGANGVFTRVASLFHDIGKMVTPHFFTENQHGTEMNVHQLLTPLESAQTIMAHVGEGVAMARKAGLPEQFVDIIKQHHGTQLVYYFYRKALDQAGGDRSLVDEGQYRYPGPKPRSKETVVIMIADSFEAAARSLDQINERTLTELMDRIVREKAQDGQFDECLLTFEELSIVRKTMVQTLLAGLHTRIKYPKRESR